MNPFEFVLIIIGMVFVMAIVMKKMEPRHGRGRNGRNAGIDPASAQENERLRKEVAQLTERLKVLERITVEKENSLEREIEQLRDR